MAGLKSESPLRLIPWLYDLGLWIMTLCVNLFFREIYPRGAWSVPRKGPVLIVAAPHANQFVDSVILMDLLKSQAKRRVSFLIAEKSMKEPYIGTLASCMGVLPVVRAMDQAKLGKGTIYQPDPDSEPTLIRGIGTDFTQPEFMVGGSIIIPSDEMGSESAPIAEIIAPNALRLKKPFRSLQPRSGGTDKGSIFKVAPHIDQSHMFNAAFNELSRGGCIGIFPEGGSHDRSDLLPLKPGAALMALGTLARYPDCGLSIVPCGMNYFRAHKFRSRAVIEFGRPIHVHPDQVEAYKAGGRLKRNAVGSLLETIYEGLASVTQISPDHETLILVQTTRKLYNTISKKLPLPLVIEFNRRLLKGYTQHQSDPRVVQLKKSVSDYNRQLEALGVKDHQVEWGNAQEKPWWLIFITLFYRLARLLVLSVGTLPGVLMFWPVFVTSKVVSEERRRRALASSTVKLEARDVVSTWKILVAAGLAPSLYVFYTVVVTAWLYYSRKGGYYYRTYIPDSIPLWAFSCSFLALMISVTFAALRFGEIGMDIVKSLPPLLVALNPWSSPSLAKLQAHREALSVQVTDTINSLGLGLVPEVEAGGIPIDSYTPDAYQSLLKSVPPSEAGSRERSRSRSTGRTGSALHASSSVHVKPLSSITSASDLHEVNKKIQNHSNERGRKAGNGAGNGFETGETILKYAESHAGFEGKKKR